MINDKVDPFITQYRDAIERQRDLSTQYIDNQRRNDFAGIMSGANTAGMMYSNFPERSKIQYNATTYTPNMLKVQDTYRTGLDKLRSNTIDLHNQLTSINEAISDLNKKSSSGGSGGSGGGNGGNGSGGGDDAPTEKTWDYGNGYSIKGTKGGEASYYKDGKKISAGDFLWDTGVMKSGPKLDIWKDIWDSGVKTNGVGYDTVNMYIPKNYKKLLEPATNEQYSYLYK